ncbi:hypothetical protein [Photobacterium iliopiscarium]|nr:hypothetical protein [Photobacterium iliopiscarium]
MNTTYFEDNNESTRLANDWQCSVVTLEKFVTVWMKKRSRHP